MADNKKNEKAREVDYAEKTPSRIWLEEASDLNPYQSESLYCHGYSVSELAEQYSFSDTIFLALKGELPAAAEKKLFDAVLVSFLFPGPRHPAARAACAAGVGKSQTENILPVALTVIAGERNGAKEVDQCMRFLIKARRKAIADIVSDDAAIPGFGTFYGGPDIRAHSMLQQLMAFDAAGDACQLASDISQNLDGRGIAMTGVFAATMIDLGFKPAQAVVLFQLANAPGLAAHGLDLAGRPLNAVPFVPDEEYYFE